MRLAEAIEFYVTRRRSEGAPYISGEITLRSFCKHIGDIPLNHLTINNMVAFLDCPRLSPITLRGKYSVLNRFLRFWRFRESLPLLVLPKPATEETVFDPHIYTRAEIRSLLRTTSISQEGSQFISGETLKTILLTLYATGAMVSEVINLQLVDLDPRRRQLRLSGDHRMNERCIPISRDLYQRLKAFSLRRRSEELCPTLFFQAINGKTIDRTYLCRIFALLRQIAGVPARDRGRRPPRMKDFRPTFAVHRLVSWMKQGDDLNRMIPALSTYMGYSELAAAERFLAFTPERFREQLNKLSPRKSRKHWRDDLKLMSFLAGL